MLQLIATLCQADKTDLHLALCFSLIRRDFVDVVLSHNALHANREEELFDTKINFNQIYFLISFGFLR